MTAPDNTVEAPRRGVSSLAIFGGAPRFQPVLHVGRPNAFDRQPLLEAINGILNRAILTNNGPEVEGLEKEFAEKIGVRHAIAVSNATTALQLVAHAMGLKGRVLVPSFTFVATVHALKWIGLEPVFGDVAPATHNLAPEEVEKHVAAGISAVVGVHVWGRLCAPTQLEGLCRAHHVPLVFDAAHAMGCGTCGRMAGTFGDAEIFSLHATKVCQSFEGGMITTNRGSLARSLRRMRNFGFSGYDQVDSLGTNAKLNEVAAAMGRVSLRHLEAYREVNRNNHATYAKGLGAIDGLKLLTPFAGEESNFHYVVTELDPRLPGDARDLLYHVLHREGVLARRYFHPGVHRMEPYRSDPGYAGLSLPNTESLCRRVLCLPNGTSVTRENIMTICDLTDLVLKNLPEIRERMPFAKLDGGGATKITHDSR